MGKCLFHPGREVTASVAGKGYCAQCEAAQRAARALVDAHVKPKDCFIWYIGGDTWEPIEAPDVPILSPTRRTCAPWVGMPTAWKAS
jgi:hypothetical protein